MKNYFTRSKRFHLPLIILFLIISCSKDLEYVKSVEPPPPLSESRNEINPRFLKELRSDSGFIEVLNVWSDQYKESYIHTNLKISSNDTVKANLSYLYHKFASSTNFIRNHKYRDSTDLFKYIEYELNIHNGVTTKCSEENYSPNEMNAGTAYIYGDSDAFGRRVWQYIRRAQNDVTYGMCSKCQLNGKFNYHMYFYAQVLEYGTSGVEGDIIKIMNESSDYMRSKYQITSGVNAIKKFSGLFCWNIMDAEYYSKFGTVHAEALHDLNCPYGSHTTDPNPGGGGGGGSGSGTEKPDLPTGPTFASEESIKWNAPKASQIINLKSDLTFEQWKEIEAIFNGMIGIDKIIAKIVEIGGNNIINLTIDPDHESVMSGWNMSLNNLGYSDVSEEFFHAYQRAANGSPTSANALSREFEAKFYTYVNQNVFGYGGFIFMDEDTYIILDKWLSDNYDNITLMKPTTRMDRETYISMMQSYKTHQSPPYNSMNFDPDYGFGLALDLFVE